MNPVLINIGPLQVHWYGVLIVVGALLAAWLSTKEAERRGEDPEHVWNLLTWVLILGIIGARLYHVFSTPTGNFAGWAYYREHPTGIIKFWDGGFRGLGIYRRDRRRRHRRGHLRTPQPPGHSCAGWISCTPGLILAQAIGRMGNRINQELYGPPDQRALGLSHQSRLTPARNRPARQWPAASPIA